MKHRLANWLHRLADRLAPPAPEHYRCTSWTGEGAIVEQLEMTTPLRPGEHARELPQGRLYL